MKNINKKLDLRIDSRLWSQFNSHVKQKPSLWLLSHFRPRLDSQLWSRLSWKLNSQLINNI